MKRIALAVLPLVIFVSACSSAGSGAGKPGAPATDRANETPEEQAARLREEQLTAINQARALTGLAPLGEEDLAAPAPSDESFIVVDKETGRRLEKIPKSPSLRVVDGKLRHAQLNPEMFLLELVREDEGFYYVAAPEPKAAKAAATRGEGAVPEGLSHIRDVPPGEYEVVEPKRSKVRLRLEEKSEGLPTSGYWRTNMDAADLDGDGRAEIVTGPPRLSDAELRVFRFNGNGWAAAPIEVREAATGVALSYGGVAVADMDQDGRPDILTIGHGAGPAIAFNEGGLKFRLESRGLPEKMRGQAIAAGDVDGDGLPDVVAVSDFPEAQEAWSAAQSTGSAAPRRGQVDADGYRYGYDARAFFGRNEGGQRYFAESTAGLDVACFAYSLALGVPAKGAPYFVSGCNYMGGRALLFEWDAASKAFRHVGRGVVEEYSSHRGSATGTYRGHPAAFATYIKGNAPGAIAKPIRGHGLSVYYRDAEGWKRKRIVKVLVDQGTESAGVAAGDLNGDGLDDVVWGDDAVGRIRVFFQTPAGEFEELAEDAQPRYPNHSTSVKIVDVDKDGRNDIVFMYQFLTTDKTRAGGLRFFRNAG